MRIKNPEDYILLYFEVATDNKHKYNAVMKNVKDGRIKKIPFGAIGYEQYYDKIGYYKEYNHKNKERRRLYRLRHKGEEENKFSSGYFAIKCLW